MTDNLLFHGGGPPYVATQEEQGEEEGEREEREEGEEETGGGSIRCDQIAQAMWEDYQQVLAEREHGMVDDNDSSDSDLEVFFVDSLDEFSL